MSDAAIPWEFGKHGITAIFLLSMIVRWPEKLPAVALVFFALLLPSILVSLSFIYDFNLLREALSAYLSGPLTLTVSACFFANIKLTKQQMLKLFSALICPVFSIAAISIVATATASELQFSGNSNLVTSGGFGPNQVSAALGLGAMLSFLLILYGSNGVRWKIMMSGFLVIFASASAMTFSRGGLYCAVSGAIPCLFFVSKDPRLRAKVLSMSVLVLVLGFAVILPGLDRFTDGALTARFSDATVTHRDEILQSDLELWRDNPLLGVGPGMAHEHRSMSHTEYSRLLAEHGILGLGAIIALVFAAVTNLKKQRTPGDKALTASMLGWSMAYMVDKAMRTAAPAFMFGLAFTEFTDEADTLRNARSAMKKRARLAEEYARLNTLQDNELNQNKTTGTDH